MRPCLKRKENKKQQNKAQAAVCVSDITELPASWEQGAVAISLVLGHAQASAVLEEGEGEPPPNLEEEGRSPPNPLSNLEEGEEEPAEPPSNLEKREGEAR